VGKEVGFNVVHTIPSGGEFANVVSAPVGAGQPPQDVATVVVSAGWAKARDNAPEALKDAEAAAQAEGKGIWSAEAETVSLISNVSFVQLTFLSSALFPSRCPLNLMLSLPSTRARRSMVSKPYF
jgi:hypothetical protein